MEDQDQQSLIAQIFKNVQGQYGRLDLKEVERQMIEYRLQPDLSQIPAPHLHDDDVPEVRSEGQL